MFSRHRVRSLITIVIILQLILSFVAPGAASAAAAAPSSPLVERQAGSLLAVPAAPNALTSLSVEILTTPWATLDHNDPTGSGGEVPKVYVIEGRVTNTGAEAAINVVVNLNYNVDPANNWVLLPGEDPERSIDTLAPGESYYVYWLARYSTSIGATHTYSISAYADNAPLVTTSNNFYGNPQPGKTVQTRGVLSTGNSGVSQVSANIQVGVAFTVTVTYDLGSDPQTAAFSPMGNTDFNAGAYRLLSSSVRFFNDAGTWESVVDERLYFPAIDPQADNADARYVFIALAAANTRLCPYTAANYNSSTKYDQFYCDPDRNTVIPIEGTLKFTMDKQVSSSTIQQGQVLTYTIYYENTGGLPISYAWIWDDIDATLVSIITPTIDPPSDPLETTESRVAWYLGGVPAMGQPGSSGILTFSVLVDPESQDIPDGTMLVNDAFFGINQGSLPSTIALTDTVSTQILAPKVTISKTDGATTVEPGDPLTYQLQVTNNGTLPVETLVVTDVLPTYVTLTGAPTPPADFQNGQTLVWTGLAPLAPNGGSVTISIPTIVDIKTPNGTVLTNQMLAEYTNPSGHIYHDLQASDTTLVNAPVLTISKTDFPDPVLTGYPLYYTLAYANIGPAEATNVVITDVVPLSTTYSTCSGAPCSMSAGIVTWNLGTVAANTSGTVQLTVIVDEGLPTGTFIDNNDYGILSDQTDYLAGASVRTTVSRNAANFVGYTFLDADVDGEFDAGESWLTGVPVTLTQATVPNTVTDANGYYAFRVEVAGPVVVSAALPTGYFRTTDGEVIAESILGITQTVNFGYAPTGSPFGAVHGTVYQDNDADGTQDLGDYGLEGVSISSSGAVVSPVTTNELGQYTLRYNTAGIKTVVETNLPLFVSTTPDTVQVQVILGSGSTPVDFGDYLGIMIGGMVFEDADVDGNKDAGEPGVANAVVTAGGQSFTTDSNGNYSLYLAAPTGDPIDIHETDAPGYLSSNALPGSGAVKIDVNTLRISNPLSGTMYLNNDFADVSAAEVIIISGMVWDDNGAGGGGLANGVHDGAEPGLAGALVSLSSGLSQTTSSDGLYLLYAPADQVITILETNPAGYVSTNAIPGPFANKTDNDTLTTLALPGGSSAAGNLFGDVLASSVVILQGTVFDDENENGILDLGELGIPGNLVTLETEDGSTISLLTDANGTFEFAVAPQTNIAITAERPASPYYPTTPETLFLYPPAPGVYPNTNFGFSNDTDVAVIYGIVFDDLNSNGYQEFGELGLANAILTLNDGITQTTVADGSLIGTFAFTVTEQRIHYIVETNPAGYRSTTPDALNIPVMLGNSHYVDFGDVNYPFNASIYGTVFDDFNSNGYQEPGEPGLSGVTISVTVGGPGGFITATTKLYGQYSYGFDVSEQGYHQVSEQDPARPGYRSTTPDEVNLYIELGNSYIVDFGDTDDGFSSLMGIVFDDFNSDGNQDPAELGLPGVLISLSNGATTTTGQYGTYTFAIPDPGNYEVSETDLPGYHSTTPNLVPLTVEIEHTYQVNFGDSLNEYVSSIFGSVFNDLNVNGLRDPGEPALPGVLVSLDNDFPSTYLTNEWGQYTFLVEHTGIFTVTETDDAGWVSTNAIPGSPAVVKLDNNTLRAEVSTLGIDLGDNLFADAEQSAVVTIDGLVWNDNGAGSGTGGDGLQNGSEPGMAGVLVSLSSGMSQLTASDGSFLLYAPPGQFVTIEETNPAGYISTGAIPGTNASLQDLDHIVVVETLSGGQSSLGNLFGDVLIAAGLNLTKQAEDLNGEPLLVGDTILYTLQVNNTGGTPAYNVTVTDQLPEGITFVEMLPTNGTVSGPNPVIWTLPVLEPAASETLWITATIDLDQVGQTITNTGSVTSSNIITPPIDPPEVCPDGSLPVNGECPTTPQEQSDIAVTKTASTDIISAGDPLTYTITVTNLGPSAAGQTVVTDTLPGDVTFSSYSATQGSFDNATGLWTVGSLPAGAGATLTLFVTVNPDAASLLVNTAQAASEDYDPQLANNTAAAQTALDTLSDLSITKSDTPDPVAAGGILTYTLAFANAGPSNAQSLVITDVLPAEVTFLGVVSQPGYLSGPTQNGQSLIWTAATLPAGASGSIVFTVFVHPQASGSITNQALISSLTAEADPANNEDFESTAVGTSAQATIFGWVYDDLNGNGVKDAGEAGLPDVVVTLDGSFTAVTNSGGLYFFLTDVAGLHAVVETDPAGYVSTTPNEVHVTVVLGNSYQVDFGDVLDTAGFAAIYGTVFEDSDGDGTWDIDEPGLPGVTITLDGSATTTTDQYGSYSMNVTQAGVHTVVETDLPGYFSTTPNEVHVLVVLGNSYQVDFGDALETSDFASIYGTVFEDLDGDGIWDTGETGLANVSLTLDGVSTATTNQYGAYSFNVTQPGVHTVVETDPDGYFSTTPNEVHLLVVIGQGYQVDFGDAPGSSAFATLYGTVFEDLDGDGVWDDGEAGLPDVTLTLDDATNTTTDQYGAYSFLVTTPGVHKVVETDLSGYFSTTPNEVHVAVVLGNGYRVDFGDALDSSGFATLFGTVFEDTDMDGVWDAEEIGISGVSLTLDGTTNATTNAYGSYTFNITVAGLHTIVETDLDGYVSTTPNEVQVDVVIGNGYQVDFGDVLLCTCDPDAFEDDDTFDTAAPIELGPDGRQARDFCDDSADWLSFTAQAGGVYTLTTSAWGQRTDTFLALFDTDGQTLLAANDDYQGALDYSSQIVWEAPAGGTYFIQVTNRAGLTCCSTDYDIWVEGTYQEFVGQFLPMVVKDYLNILTQPELPSLPQPQGVISHMCPDAYEVDDSWELAQPILPDVLQVHSFDSNPALFAADKDVVAFTVYEGDVVTFTVTTLTGTQTLLELFDKYGNALNVTGTTQIVWEVPVTGTYFLSVAPQMQTYGCVNTAGYELLMQLHQPVRTILPLLYK